LGISTLAYEEVLVAVASVYSTVRLVLQPWEKVRETTSAPHLVLMPLALDSRVLK